MAAGDIKQKMFIGRVFSMFSVNLFNSQQNDAVYLEV